MKAIPGGLIIERGDWGALPPSAQYGYVNPKGKSITFHWEGSTLPDYSKDAAYGIVRHIQQSHMNNEEENYVDIAYNFLIDSWGQVFEGRGVGARSAANGTSAGNSASLAVCFLGGPAGPVLSAAARLSFAILRAWMVNTFGVTLEVVGHRNWIATQCPGDSLYQYVTQLNGSPANVVAINESEIDDMFSDDDRKRMDNLNNQVGKLVEQLNPAFTLGPGHEEDHFAAVVEHLLDTHLGDDLTAFKKMVADLIEQHSVGGSLTATAQEIATEVVNGIKVWVRG